MNRRNATRLIAWGAAAAATGCANPSSPTSNPSDTLQPLTSGVVTREMTLLQIIEEAHHQGFVLLPYSTATYRRFAGLNNGNGDNWDFVINGVKFGQVGDGKIYSPINQDIPQVKLYPGDTWKIEPGDV